MPQLATQQLDSIHSMLSAGHRNLRVERHSLVLWGTSCGGLILASDRIITAAQFPVLEQRAIAWLILLPPLLAQQLASADVPPDAPVVSLEEFRKQPDTKQFVALPAGSTIPVKVEVSGDIFRASNASVLPLELNQPIEIMMSNGQPTGDWRFPGESWLPARETHWISIPWIKAELTPQTGPIIRTSLVVQTRYQTTR